MGKTGFMKEKKGIVLVIGRPNDDLNRE